MIPYKTILVPALSGLLLSPVLAQTQAPARPQSASQSQKLTPVSLRGYGKIEARRWAVPGQDSASVLEISTESTAKAQLVQAKYLSDLISLPGVKTGQITPKPGPLEIHEVAGQGAIAALRTGTRVYLFTAKDATELSKLISARAALFAAKPVSKAEIKVPMWLDRWDKNSFRFYYREWELPEGVKRENYDFTKEFDFARDQQKAGFVFWNNPFYMDGAEAMMNENFWDWAFREARKRNLPVGINDGSGSEFTAWVLNRYREQTQGEMPGYIGTFYSPLSTSTGQQGHVSWNATTAKDAQLGVIQESVRRFAAEPNVTSLLEPHGEVRHGQHDILMEYGPTADTAFRRYLRGRYKDISVINARWATTYRSWHEIRVPELAEFAGGGSTAYDLKGKWRIGYEAYKDAEKPNLGTIPAPPEWTAGDFDDSTWPAITAPGDEIQLFLPRRPAIFRRTFDLPADYKNKNPRLWLYLWDLHKTKGESMPVWVNGREVDRTVVKFNSPHWTAVEVSQDLKAGRNVVAMREPLGFFAYRTYISPEEPRIYPNLGEARNARWADFNDFHRSSRFETGRRGMEMIRQVEPNKQITMMSPDSYADDFTDLAKDYGGQFHNTGYMSAFYSDYLPSIMRGAGLPMSLEPGNPAYTLDDFKHMVGLYQTQGLQGIDYFIHIGAVMWKPDIRAYFEKERNQLALLGKYHYPRAEVATFQSDRVAGLTGWPWDSAPNGNIKTGYWNWNASTALREYYPTDGLVPSSFRRGDAAKYKVIIDSNTSILDESQVSEIETWVRNGGVFITFGQTGRHTPEKPDSWPLARLTGYKVLKIDELAQDGGLKENGLLLPAPGQTLFGADWTNRIANGLHLEKQAADAVDLLKWKDGSVAAGYRPLGKGVIVQLGAKFHGAQMFDRMEPGGNTPEIKALRQMFSALLDWRNIKREPASVSPANEFVLLRHAVTNNGLFDVWTLWNQSKTEAQNVSVAFEAGLRPTAATEVRTGLPFPLMAGGAGLPDIALAPQEARVFLTPRGKLASAPLEWLTVQSNWWQGTRQPAPKKLPTPQELQKWSRDLTNDWAVQYLESTADASSILAVSYDDKKWPRRKIGTWNPMDVGGKQRAVFRRQFTVPTDWKNGIAALWCSSWFSTTFVDGGRVLLDGEQVWPIDKSRFALADGPRGIELASLKPGTAHDIAVEMSGKGSILGLRGQLWISFVPEPESILDLSGQYDLSKDGLVWEAPVSLPGSFTGQFLRRTIKVDAARRDKTALLMVNGEGSLAGVFINGRLIKRHHHLIGGRWSLNITPYIKWGEDNELTLFSGGSGKVNSVQLGFYQPGFYP